MVSVSLLVPNIFPFNRLCFFQLQAKHTQENCETWGVNGETGTLVDMKELGIWEPLAVKLQTYKTAVEVRQSKSYAVLFEYSSKDLPGNSIPLLIFSSLKKQGSGNFPGGPVVKTLLSTWGCRFRILVGSKDPTCLGARKPKYRTEIIL